MLSQGLISLYSASGVCLSGWERVKVFDVARVIIAGTGSKQPAAKQDPMC